MRALASFLAASLLLAGAAAMLAAPAAEPGPGAETRISCVDDELAEAQSVMKWERRPHAVPAFGCTP